MGTRAGVILDVKGIDEINKSLLGVPKKIRNKVAPKVLLKAAQLMVTEAKIQAPVGPAKDIFGRWRRPGALRKSIKAKLQSINRWAGVEVLVKPFGKPARYAHLVEFGHRIVIYGEHTANATPNAFMRRSFMAKADAVNEAAMQMIMTGMVDVMSKADKRRLGVK